jgi:hypothetical protein
MSTNPIKLATLKPLVEQGYDLAVLSTIQRDVVMQVLEQFHMEHIDMSSPQVVLDYADNLLPNGFELQSLYFKRSASMASSPVEDLEQIASTLSLCAHHLEEAAVKGMSKDVTLRNHALMEQTISTRYAQLIQGATTLESYGVISTHLAERLTKLTERPSGPLGAFYDKALVMIEAGPEQRDHQRMRAAA